MIRTRVASSIIGLTATGLALVSAAGTPGCAPRDDSMQARRAPAESPAGPPFTLEVVREGRALHVRTVTTRALRGRIDLALSRPDGRDDAHASAAPDDWHTFAIDDGDGPWQVEARWLDPRGVAGATAVRQIPEAPEVAPRFEPMRPARIGGLRVDEAVRLH